MRAFETAVSAVSEPAKNADSTSSAKIANSETVRLNVMARDPFKAARRSHARPHHSVLRKNRAHCLFRDVARDEGVADALGENERHPAALRLLVVTHVREQLIGLRSGPGDLRDPCRQSDAGEDGARRASTSAARACPRAAESLNASTQPSATLSPWSSRSE